ncbi:hypothetical protein chiPu_0014635 [Chiloscyllium punctatum]|uniref:SEA domain-containing protein n=1 Tax=Chiloscyllium punctatum TaxID=137246 RepID=A0A401T0G9_CHIPU|nr:hypothetical protein [Chiloscyllium punctatum]
METRSTGSMWEKSNSVDAPSYTGSVNRPEQRRATTTVLPTQTTGQSEMTTDITATVTKETAFIAFRASISIINWNFTEDLNNKTSTAYRNMEELFVTETLICVTMTHVPPTVKPLSGYPNVHVRMG